MNQMSKLTIAVVGSGQSFYNLPTSGYLRRILLNLVLGRLMSSDPTIEDKGSLLASPPTTDDFVRWSFQLKDDLAFCDGRKATSLDVKKSFEYLFLSPYETPDQSLLKAYLDLHETECHGSQKISFKLKRPCLEFDKILHACTYSPIPLEHLISPLEHLKVSSAHSGAHIRWKNFPIGCGPFSIIETLEGGRIIHLKRKILNKNKFNFIKLISSSRNIPEADLILGSDENPSPGTFSQVTLPEPFFIYGLYFDYQHPLAKNVEFRKYLSQSIDRDQLHKVVPSLASNPLPLPKKWTPKELSKKLNNPSFHKKSLWVPKDEIIKINPGKSADPTRALINNELMRQWKEMGLRVEFDEDQSVASLAGLIPGVPGPLQIFQLFQRGGSWIEDLGDIHITYQRLMEKAEAATSSSEQELVFEELAQEFARQTFAIPLFEYPLVLYARADKMDLSSVGTCGAEVLPENIVMKL